MVNIVALCQAIWRIAMLKKTVRQVRVLSMMLWWTAIKMVGAYVLEMNFEIESAAEKIVKVVVFGHLQLERVIPYEFPIISSF